MSTVGHVLNVLAAVGEVAGDVEACLLTELHLHNALVPAYGYGQPYVQPNRQCRRHAGFTYLE
jgi:hypothetical protein